MALIPNKIIIPAETPRVSRGRLLKILEESRNNCGSTFIIGRAGTGKTLLAVDFARRCEWRVAWYKVNAPDVDLQIFVQYLVASVARESPGFGGRILSQLTRSSALTNPSALAESYIYELQKQDVPLLLVIDDLHLAFDADWVVPFFHRLLPLLPAEVHLLIIGRSLLPAPLWRLRSKQRLVVIDEPLLAFTPEEAEVLFAGYELSPEQANTALIKTRGRAAALHAEARRITVLGKTVVSAPSPHGTITSSCYTDDCWLL